MTMATALLLGVAGCGGANRPPQAPAGTVPDAAALEAATITGSAESPDPVLERVRALEARGEVVDVVVQESFPVQIRLRAPRRVIDELQAMPREGGLR